jgi:hypothetical protein
MLPLGKTCIGAVSAAALAAVVTTAGAQSPPGSGPYGTVPAVSIRAEPNPVVFGSTIRVSGSLRRNTRNVAITLLGRTFSPRGTFRGLGTDLTDRSGDYRFTVKPTAHTVYRVVTGTRPPARSTDLIVRVRSRVGLRVSSPAVRAGRLVRFTGRVWPRHNGSRVYIQRRGPRGGWGTVARPVLTAFDSTSSRYVRRLRIRRSGVYRVKLNGHNDHATGHSRVVSVAAR